MRPALPSVVEGQFGALSDEELAAAAVRAHEQAVASADSAVESATRAGELLAEAQRRCSEQKRSFSGWLLRHWPKSDKTAYRYIALAQATATQVPQLPLPRASKVAPGLTRLPLAHPSVRAALEAIGYDAGSTRAKPAAPVEDDEAVKARLLEQAEIDKVEAEGRREATRLQKKQAQINREIEEGRQQRGAPNPPPRATFNSLDDSVTKGAAQAHGAGAMATTITNAADAAKRQAIQDKADSRTRRVQAQNPAPPPVKTVALAWRQVEKAAQALLEKLDAEDATPDAQLPGMEEYRAQARLGLETAIAAIREGIESEPAMLQKAAGWRAGVAS